MFLRKWYLDCVALDGTYWIGYWAELLRGRLRLIYESSLSDGFEKDRFVVYRDLPEPILDVDRLSWKDAQLGFAADFRCVHPSFDRELFQDERGRIRWRCLSPLTQGTVWTSAGRITGRGYIEILEFTVPPWGLPIDRLRWGRFTGSEFSVVWIDWRGRVPLRRAVFNGRDVGVLDLTESRVQLEDGTVVALHAGRLIRRGKLRESLSSLGVLRLLLPARVLDAFEEKWCCAATLAREGKTLDAGWVIHERVAFPRVDDEDPSTIERRSQPVRKE